MEILDEKDGVDTELLVYAMTLINKVCVSAGSTCVGVFILFFDCLTCAKCLKVKWASGEEEKSLICLTREHSPCSIV